MLIKSFHSQNRGPRLRKRGGYTVTESLIVLVLLGVISLLILGLVRRSLRPASERDPAKLPAAATAPGAPSTAAPEPTPAPAAEKAKEKAATE